MNHVNPAVCQIKAVKRRLISERYKRRLKVKSYCEIFQNTVNELHLDELRLEKLLQV